MTDFETETVAGVVDGVTQKGPDKWQVAIKPEGAKYAKSCWTKSATLQATFGGLIGQSVVVLCNVSHWETSEGEARRSLWIDSLVGPGDAGNDADGFQAPRQGVPTPETSQGVTARHADPTRTSIEKQTSLKASVEFHAGSNANPAVVIATAGAFYEFISGTPAPLTDQAEAENDARMRREAGQADDDSIPF